MPPTPGKKPFSQPIPEQLSEPVPPSSVIIIHPGSYNLRIGRASDTFPVAVPHCIARKKRSQSTPYQPEAWLARPECNHPDVKQQKRLGLKSAEEALLTKPTAIGGYRQLTPGRELASYNCSVKPERTDVVNPQKWTTTDKPYIVGGDALLIHPSSNYSLHWPIRRGHLNVHSGSNETLNSVLADLEVIWQTVIETHLNIPQKNFQNYHVILLIPDVYVHKHVKALMNLLLDKLGFGAAFIHLESVCAIFGSGISCACVVDVGDQKTSVCCVEDGISQKSSRIVMEYGGVDVSRCLHWMLGRCGFPLRELNLSLPVDILLLQQLKESLCHMDINDNGGVIDQFVQIKRPQTNIIKYNIKLGDELLLSTLSLLFPEMYGLHGAHLVHVQSRFAGDPDDPHDESYLRQTQRAGGQSGKTKKDNPEMTRDASESSLIQLDENMQVQGDDDSNDAPDSLPASETKLGRRTEMEEEEEKESEPVAQLMGVDEAILYSIEKCARR
ncbi:actin-related protein 8-like isoform X2 [Gigantopelta aegis]|uniref:actin-related protein 8-like isoform X2 n=1 Tax=Gigantopelta aegis TaxID=1735272 RepID=UPI001B88B5DF|nr:actin-related protein 8-like isoform X2 [Gigantopelta aegis]